MHANQSREIAAISNSARYRVPASKIDQTFLIDVAAPLAPPSGALPVIFVLDGNINFPIVASITRLLQMSPYPMTPALVVGIGYPVDTPEEGALAQHLRVRDMTPWVDARIDAQYRAAPPPWRLPDHIKQGGADAFSAFIEDDLKPFIASHYPVNLDDATLVGVSLGGLFAVYSLLTAPTRFKRYIAASPGLYWDRRQIFEIETALATRVKDLPAHLFLSAGGLEERMDATCKFVSNVYELEARLAERAYPSLDMTFHVFPDETHMSVVPAALSRGLTAVFGGHGETRNWARALDTA